MVWPEGPGAAAGACPILSIRSAGASR